MKKTSGHILGGSLMVAGVTIGVGMLAMPLVTYQGGFFPALALYLICWFFMLCTGLLLLEACLWMPRGANMITMARTLLGPIGQAVCWITYLFLFLLIMISLISGGGGLIAEILDQIPPAWVSIFIFVIIFAPFVYLGTLSVDHANSALMIGLFLSYLIFVLFLINFVNFELLKRVDWLKSFIAIPILFVAFAYQSIIPTLVTYMDRNVKKIRLSIFIGTGIAFIVYVFFEFTILGAIPAEGPNSLMQAAASGQISIFPLKAFAGYSHFLSSVQNNYLFLFAKIFAFFAITTSFITVSLAYRDFLADGLKWEKTPKKKLWLCCLIFSPPTVISMIFPNLFLKAASYAGGYFCAILFGLFPILMVWAGRHIHHYPDETKQLFGGKYFLSVLILFVIFEIAIHATTEFLGG